MRYCRKCVSPSTRPFLTIGEDGICSACRYWEEKDNTIDWAERNWMLKKLCNRYRRTDGFDVIVPASGGKDSSYCAWFLKTQFDMHPLTVTWDTCMWTDLGRENLQTFIDSGYDNILIRPNPNIYRAINKKGFIEDGYPKRGFVMGLAPSITQLSIGLGIPFVCWGESEVEYEGHRDVHTDSFQIKYDDFLSSDDFCGNDPREYLPEGIREQEARFWMMPSQGEMDEAGLYQTYLSYYDYWDDEKHRKVAVEHCGLKPGPENADTFTTFSQTDDIMQPLFMYMAFIKYGISRVGADVCLAIRTGRMSREEGIAIVTEKGDIFPREHIEAYLEYFGMTRMEFADVLATHVDHDILKPGFDIGKPWVLKEAIS